VPPSTGFRRSRWGADVLFRGSYSFVPAGCGDARRLFADLAAPVTARARAGRTGGAAEGALMRASHLLERELERPSARARLGIDCAEADAGDGEGAGAGGPTVLFAGEATHARYYSCAHAAYESGRREALRATRILRA
jgi:hypothetical protein